MLAHRSISSSVRYLLLQIRNANDPVRVQEIDCFARVLDCQREQIRIANMLTDVPSDLVLAESDIVLIGGSGHYSATSQAAWLHRTLDVLCQLHRRRKPTFASCWGFQAMARALGGKVIHDIERAELGSNLVQLTDVGQRDPVLGPTGKSFYAQMGHEDCVVQLPAGAIHLARSRRVEFQAFRLRDEPIYCTQFHPELNRDNLIERIKCYPEYVERISGLPLEQFAATCRESIESNQLLSRFVKRVLGEEIES